MDNAEYFVFIKPAKKNDPISFLSFGVRGVSFVKDMKIADSFSKEDAEELAQKDELLHFAHFTQFDKETIYIYQEK